MSDITRAALALETAAECGDYVRRARDIYVDITPMERIILAAFARLAPEPPQGQDHARFMFDPTCPECQRLRKTAPPPQSGAAI